MRTPARLLSCGARLVGVAAPVLSRVGRGQLFNTGPICFPLIPRRRAGQTRRGCAGGSGPGCSITAKAAQAVAASGGASMVFADTAPPEPFNHTRRPRTDRFPGTFGALVNTHGSLLGCQQMTTETFAWSATNICKLPNQRNDR